MKPGQTTIILHVNIDILNRGYQLSTINQKINTKVNLDLQTKVLLMPYGTQTPGAIDHMTNDNGNIHQPENNNSEQ